ncbi:MAG: PilZ domain-containing protein [Treponema sp.]|nr:PilZ domain-containing protein [Treponema sp.]
MGISNNNQNSRYYDFFREQEIIFTKSNIQILHLDLREVYIKFNGGQWPCIINSTSLQSAKIIIGTASGAYKEMVNNPKVSLSLRYSFIEPNESKVQFFVACAVDKIIPLPNTEELVIVSLLFTQRPPDDLISRIGEFIETNENFKNRKEDRIEINQNSIRKLGIEREESIVFVEGIPRKCILKDLSFGGAKIMFVGIPKFLIDKPVDLKITFSETNDTVGIKGVVKDAEFLEGRKDIASVHIKFDEDKVPLLYKRRINNYITTYQKNMLNNKRNNL